MNFYGQRSWLRVRNVSDHVNKDLQMIFCRPRKSAWITSSPMLTAFPENTSILVFFCDPWNIYVLIPKPYFVDGYVPMMSAMWTWSLTCTEYDFWVDMMSNSCQNVGNTISTPSQLYTISSEYSSLGICYYQLGSRPDLPMISTSKLPNHITCQRFQ